MALRLFRLFQLYVRLGESWLRKLWNCMDMQSINDMPGSIPLSWCSGAGLRLVALMSRVVGGYRLFVFHKMLL